MSPGPVRSRLGNAPDRFPQLYQDHFLQPGACSDLRDQTKTLLEGLPWWSSA